MTNHTLKAEVGAYSITGVDVELTVHRRLPPEHPIHCLVGRVADAWSHVEHLLDIIIWQLAKVDDVTGACITGQIIGSFPRITAIRALCIHRKVGAGVLQQIEQLTRKIKDCQNRRNRILHDAWYAQEGGETEQFKSMALGEFIFGFHPVDESFVTETLEKIGRRTDDVAALRNAITAVL
jgi:hypothetical protein